MRTVGNVLAGGNPSTPMLALPMGEREDREVVRARHEAKRGRVGGPWAFASTSSARLLGGALIDQERTAALFGGAS
jgi:hypothetical protein